MENLKFSGNKAELVSVVIPVHNRFEISARAINSVINQNYRPIQLIVIDDFSQEAFKFDEDFESDENFELEVVRTSSNLGPGGARELGRLLCKGKYIAYLDSDDMYHPEFLKKMVQCMKENPSIDMAYCHAKFMSPDGIISDESVKKTHLEYKYILPYLLTHGRPWHSSACIRRKSLTDKIGPWENLWFWEDYDYDTRAALINNNLHYVPEVLCYIDKEHVVKITKNPDSPKKNRSYGMAICNMARNIDKSDFDKGDVRHRVIYHLMKSSARNLDYGFYKIAQNNLSELLIWVRRKNIYIFIHLLIILNSLKLGKIVSKILRRISHQYKYS